MACTSQREMSGSEATALARDDASSDSKSSSLALPDRATPPGAESVRLPSALNAFELEAAPHVVITRAEILVDGQAVARVSDLEAQGRLQKVDALFDHFKPLAARERGEQGDAFRGRVDFWVDGDVPVLVVKSAFQTVAFAGYPNAGFVVRKRGTPALGYLPVDARLPFGPDTKRVRLGSTTVSGHLPREAIQGVIRSNFGRFRKCYEAGLERDSQLTGRVIMRFVIDRNGAVSNAVLTSSTLSDDAVNQCVLTAVQGLEFPAPEGGIVTVVYPLAFAPE